MDDLDRFTIAELDALHRTFADSAERLYQAAKAEVMAQIGIPVSDGLRFAASQARFRALFAAGDEQLELAQSITSHLWSHADA